ncbi:hypothetical protein AMECASPLE_037237 [Ameca splendens]|uniref:Uncharacterized protein n=1 Tax=Ameca splendens TaxID=208324 RepID=A0ABV0Y7R3_9TELE
MQSQNDKTLTSINQGVVSGIPAAVDQGFSSCICFGFCFTGSVQHMESRNNSIKYEEILGENIRKPKLEHHWTFKQDNGSKHILLFILARTSFFKEINILNRFFFFFSGKIKI